jgi:23S rRNA (adenine2503-C2)-methyltransferase
MEQTRPNIRAVEVAEIERFIAKMEEKPFRVKQIVEWLWQKHAHSFDEMTNLSLDLRKKLMEHFTLPALSIDTTQMSSDGTFKTRFRTFDDHMIEGVLIPTTLRKTACVSSQIGCSLSCKFCATGYMERSRNLNFDEIYDQVVMIKQQVEKTYDQNLSNIVFMGMGEPLLNYKNVL